MGKRPARQEDLVTTDLLFSVHAMLSAITKSPSLKLEEKECENLAKAANKVARHYEIHQTQKQLDWANLIMCLGATYAPRILMAKSKKASTKTGVSSVIQQNNDSLPEHNNITAISLGGAPMGVE